MHRHLPGFNIHPMISTMNTGEAYLVPMDIRMQGYSSDAPI